MNIPAFEFCLGYTVSPLGKSPSNEPSEWEIPMATKSAAVPLKKSSEDCEFALRAPGVTC